MKFFALAFVALLAGCSSTSNFPNRADDSLGFSMNLPSLNSPAEFNRSTSSMKKACGCAGNMQCCGHDSEGHLCCKPDDCSCQQVTQVDVSKESCCK